MKKGQVSFEYLIIVGFVMALLVPIIFISFSTFMEFQHVIEIKQIEQSGVTIVQQAQNVFFLGASSKKVFDITIPRSIDQIHILSNAVVFRVDVGGVYEDIIIFSDVPLSGSIPQNPGTFQITV